MGFQYFDLREKDDVVLIWCLRVGKVGDGSTDDFPSRAELPSSWIALMAQQSSSFRTTRHALRDLLVIKHI